jgi:PAS domain S-box-containing protein
MMMSPGKAKPSDKSWLELIFQQSPDGIVVQDSAGTIIEANASFSKLSNQPLSEIIGKKFSDLLCRDSKANWNHFFDKLLKNEWSNIDGTCIFTDGRKIPIEVTLIAKTESHGKHFVALHVRDMSVYHTVENALMASRNEWELSFNSIGGAMWILDRNGHILRANQAALKKTSAASPDPIGADFFDIHELKRFSGSLKDFRTKLFSAPQSFARLEFEKIDGQYSLTSSQAITLSKEYQQTIDIVLSDIIMPDMNGIELLSILRESRPQLKAIFMSGYTNSMAVESVGMDANTVFLQKPFTFEDLAKKIRASLDKAVK